MRTFLGKRRVLVGLFFLSLFSHAVSQNQQFKQFTSANGLLSDKVYNLFQDHEGFLWIFSEFGTLKYNGEDFIKVLNNLPLSESFIFSIYERADGRKWVANSNANIYEVVDDRAVLVKGFEKESEVLRKNVAEIVKIVVDDQQNIYLSTKQVSYKLNFSNGKYVPENLSRKFKGDSVRIIIYNVNGELIPAFPRLASDEFVGDVVKKQKYIYVEGSSKKIELPEEAYRLGLRHFNLIKNDIYFTNGNNLSKIDAKDSLSRIRFEAPVINFKEDGKGHIWAGCLHAGLNVLNERDSLIARYLDGMTINDVAVDFHNGIWASTDGFGLFRFPNKQSVNENEFKNEYPIKFVQKVNGGIVMGNSLGEIVLKRGLKSIKVRGIYKSVPVSCYLNGNDLIVGYLQSLEKYTFSNSDDRVQNKTFVKRCAKIFKIVPLSKDTILGVWRRGVFLYHGNSAVLGVDFGEKLVCSLIHSDTIWFGTETGLFCRSLKNWKKGKQVGIEVVASYEQPVAWPPLKIFENKFISEIQIDNRNRKWIGVRGEGIYLLTGSVLKKIASPECEIINSIEFGRNVIVVCTNRGAFVSKLNEIEKENVQWNKVYEGEVQKSVVYNENLYIQTLRGLAILKLDQLNLDGDRIYFRLSLVKVDTLTLNKNLKIELAHRTNNLVFVFDRITFDGRVPNLNYFLDGPVRQQGTNSTASITISRLLPGDYTLNVFPQMIGGEKREMHIKFNVKPEWYETWIAILIFTLVLILLIILVTSYIIKRSRKINEEKSKQEQLLLEYKMIALKAQVNPHFISNCLTAIQNLISKGNSSVANLYVARFGLLVRKILDYSSRSFLPLIDELELIQLYLQMEEIRFGRKFEYACVVDPKINANECMVPSLLLNPIIENAIWHGLLPLESDKAAKITIAISLNMNVLKIEIMDNGVGFVNKTGANSTHKSYGLEITEQRVKNLNYILHSKEGKIEIKSIIKDNEIVEGAVVTLWVPQEKTE